MRIPVIAAGLAAFFAASSANAAIIYDTVTGQTAASNKLLLVQQNHAPMGDGFNAAYTETISSVEVQLVDSAATSSTYVSDSGSILVYLVSGNSSLPLASGISLTGPQLIGTISDSSLLGGGVANNETLATSITVGPGNYWLMLTSGSDPINGNGNPVPSTAGWNEIADAGASNTIGLPVNNYSAYTNPTNTGFIDATNGYVFMAQVQAPEPASLALLGSGLMGLGLSRRRRRSRNIANNVTVV